MELGVNLGYFGMGVDQDNVAVAQEADRLGYAVAWAAEAYGSDVPTVLSWIGALTERIDLGAAVMQIPARTPAMTAMTAATLDTLSKGRFRLGLGVSGPQVSEGWHGVPFAAPLGRTREYVDIVRMALRRESLAYAGKHFTLPVPDGPGKALKLTIHPPRPDLPIYLAAVGPKNLELAGEVADGWHAIFFSPEHSGDLVQSVVDRSPARRPRHRGRTRSTVSTSPPRCPVVIADDVEAAADAIRPYAALYIGGMGSREQNFYNQLAVRMGFEEAAARGAGPLPRQAAPRRRCGGAVRVHRRHRPDRPARPDPRPAGPLRRRRGRARCRSRPSRAGSRTGCMSCEPWRS